MRGNSSHCVGEYSVDNAERFGWGSLSSDLPHERLAILKQYAVGPRILDAGCGGGGYVNYLSSNGYEAVGVDVHSDFLDHGAKRGVKGTFYQADLTSHLPFEDKHFDTTMCFDVLEHVDDRVAIRELSRVTRHRLIIIVPQEDTELSKIGLTLGPYRDLTHLRYYSRQSLNDLATLCGGEVVALFPESSVNVSVLAQRQLSVKSQWPLLTHLYSRTLEFLLKRCEPSKLHQNLAVVMDFPSSHDK